MIKILIVDDTKSIHLFVKNLLSKSNEIELQSVFDGQQAVDLLTKGKNFDLIFLDWEMPILNGPNTLLKLTDIGIKIPIIMMTTKSEVADISQALSIGAAEYMMKPFTIEILFEKISAVMKKEISYAA